VRQVQLGVDVALHLPRGHRIADDVVDVAVVQGSVVVRGVHSIIIVRQGREKHLHVLSISRW
jgi:hypothetical protein